MVTDYNVTDYINDSCYENYYRKSKKWDEYYEALAEKEDRDREELEND